MLGLKLKHVSKRGHWAITDCFTVLAWWLYDCQWPAIDLSHTFYNALVPYPTRHHCVTELCTSVHISVTKWCIGGIFVWCIVGIMRWIYWLVCTLVWLARLGVIIGYLKLHWILGKIHCMWQWEYFIFSKGQWQTFAQHKGEANCLLFGLCEETERF